MPDITLDFDTIYRIELPRGVKGDIGQAETQRDFSAAFTITPYPQIISTYPEDGDEFIEPWQGLQISISVGIF